MAKQKKKGAVKKGPKSLMTEVRSASNKLGKATAKMKRKKR